MASSGYQKYVLLCVALVLCFVHETECRGGRGGGARGGFRGGYRSVRVRGGSSSSFRSGGGAGGTAGLVVGIIFGSIGGIVALVVIIYCCARICGSSSGSSSSAAKYHNGGAVLSSTATPAYATSTTSPYTNGNTARVTSPYTSDTITTTNTYNDQYKPQFDNAAPDPSYPVSPPSYDAVVSNDDSKALPYDPTPAYASAPTPEYSASYPQPPSNYSQNGPSGPTPVGFESMGYGADR